LKTRYRLIVPDLRGYGATDKTPEMQLEYGRSRDFTDGATAFAQERQPNFYDR
jgi:pimeloyl-ACP methyl ester carboxylesterase